MLRGRIRADRRRELPRPRPCARTDCRRAAMKTGTTPICVRSMRGALRRPRTIGHAEFHIGATPRGAGRFQPHAVPEREPCGLWDMACGGRRHAGALRRSGGQGCPSAFVRSGDGRLGLTARLLARERSRCGSKAPSRSRCFQSPPRLRLQHRLGDRDRRRRAGESRGTALACRPFRHGPKAHHRWPQPAPAHRAGATLTHTRLQQNDHAVVQHDTLDVSVAEGAVIGCAR
jgi:hypothetical protein